MPSTPPTFSRLSLSHSLLPSSLVTYTGSADGTVKLYQISGKKVLQSFQHSQPSADVPASTLSDIPEGDDDQMEVDGEDTREASQSVECVGFSHQETRWVASGGLDKTLKIWDSVNGVCR